MEEQLARFLLKKVMMMVMFTGLTRQVEVALVFQMVEVKVKSLLKIVKKMAMFTGATL
jgi:hypothetical protein